MPRFCIYYGVLVGVACLAGCSGGATVARRPIAPVRLIQSADPPLSPTAKRTAPPNALIVPVPDSLTPAALHALEHPMTPGLIPRVPAKKSFAKVASLSPVVDSSISLSEALSGSDGPAQVRQSQELVDVSYYSFDGKLHKGQILIDKELAQDVREIFEEIEKSRFPIARVVPVCKYGWSDEKSMADDNSSGFNYRNMPETSVLSQHAYGRAIDINPIENPFLDRHKLIEDNYDPSKPGTLTATSAPTVAFLKHGWHWGGFWRRGKDYQHFEK